MNAPIAYACYCIPISFSFGFVISVCNCNVWQQSLLHMTSPTKSLKVINFVIDPGDESIQRDSGNIFCHF